MKSNRFEMMVCCSDEAVACVVDVPGFPGGMAQVPARRGAIRNAEDAIKFWIKTAKDDGLGIPSPRGRWVFA